MISKFCRGALILVALGAFVGVPMLNAQPVPRRKRHGRHRGDEASGGAWQTGSG